MVTTEFHVFKSCLVLGIQEHMDEHLMEAHNVTRFQTALAEKIQVESNKTFVYIAALKFECQSSGKQEQMKKVNLS